MLASDEDAEHTIRRAATRQLALAMPACPTEWAMAVGSRLLGVGQLGWCNYVELIDTIFTDVEGVD
jgi:hypothetical protein